MGNTSKRRMLRVSLALIVAPLAGALVLTSSVRVNAHGLREVINEHAIGLVTFYIFTLTSAIVLGTPAFFLFRRLGWTSYAAYGTGGLSIAFITVLLWSIGGLVGSPLNPFVFTFLAAGLASACLFRAMLGDSVFPISPVSSSAENLHV